jgi:hypothetical protein
MGILTELDFKEMIECPCCHGKKFLEVFEPTCSMSTASATTPWVEDVYDGQIVKFPCCHCMEVGAVASDNRSMNQYE